MCLDYLATERPSGVKCDYIVAPAIPNFIIGEVFYLTVDLSFTIMLRNNVERLNSNATFSVILVIGNKLLKYND